jgi:hypoxanthine phosphoribosyltransferase
MRLSGEILIGETAIHARVDALARAIAADTEEGRPLSVVALMDGAFMFCADLVRRLPMPVAIAFVPVTSIDRGGNPSAVTLPPGLPVEGADVLVVEDILDTGRTLAALRARILERRPARLRFAVLLDKPFRRAVPVAADYVGFQAPDRWIVGYGLDAGGLYRNLPYISFVESAPPHPRR